MGTILFKKTVALNFRLCSVFPATRSFTTYAYIRRTPAPSRTTSAAYGDSLIGGEVGTTKVSALLYSGFSLIFEYNVIFYPKP